MARYRIVAAMLVSACTLAACGQPTGGTAHPSASSAVPTTALGSLPTASTAPSTAGQWLTYHRDIARSGDDPSEPNVSTVSQLWQAKVDGQVYAEPLVDGGRVIVATENNTVYSLDAATGQVVWSTSLGAPVPGSDMPCGNIDPSGITGTPVIDPADGVVWVVAFVGPGEHQLVAVDLADGRVRSRQPIVLPGVDALAEQQRGALTVEHGNVYVSFGGLYGDCGNYRGFVVSFPTTGSGTQTTFGVPTAHQGAIWSPPGPAVTSAGSLVVATGNGASTSSYDDGDSVIALSPTLQVIGTFAPANWVQLNETDQDLGSVSPTLVGNEIFQVGKDGVGYLLDADNLGGIGGQLYAAQVCSAPAFGGTAVDGSVVIVPCLDGLTAIQVEANHIFRTVWSQPSVVSSAPVVAAGRVWAVTRGGRLAELDEQTGSV
ncbi:MAG TPA: PQQ-binding-like beta-propeller repeat protein, partial [Acidimicrobiales bacterium]|nr:PQQ-binding-like beta-propeller repeat protein [Acidimicrobiales bacterium]